MIVSRDVGATVGTPGCVLGSVQGSTREADKEMGFRCVIEWYVRSRCGVCGTSRGDVVFKWEDM